MLSLHNAYNHRTLDATTSFETKQQKHKEIISTIKNEALFYRPVLLYGIKAYVKTCHTKFSFHQSELLTKPQKLKNLIDKGLGHFDFKHICLKQKKEMNRHIVTLQRYEHKYEQPAFTFSALQFLSSIKADLPQIHLPSHTSQITMIESLNKEDRRM